MKPILYVAGPYSAPMLEQRDANIAAADAMGRELLALGYAVIVPHTMSRDWENDPRFEHADFLAADLAILRQCHGVVFVGNWRESTGAQQEYAEARSLGLPTFDNVLPPPAEQFELDIQSRVVLDYIARSRRGVARYGRRLYPYNGRDSLQDAYEEALDLAQYLRQLQAELPT